MKPENLEFIALFEASGWRQAEAARELKTTRATLSRCLSVDSIFQAAATSFALACSRNATTWALVTPGKSSRNSSSV